MTSQFIFYIVLNYDRLKAIATFYLEELVFQILLLAF